MQIPLKNKYATLCCKSCGRIPYHGTTVKIEAHLVYCYNKTHSDRNSDWRTSYKKAVISWNQRNRVNSWYKFSDEDIYEDAT